MNQKQFEKELKAMGVGYIPPIRKLSTTPRDKKGIMLPHPVAKPGTF